MVADGLIASADAELLLRSRIKSSEHPLEIIAERNWHSAAEPHRALTLDALVEWLAGKLGVPYLHIDPLKIDLVAVTATMSNAYAERYRILPVEATRTTLTVATDRAVRPRLGRRARADPAPANQAGVRQPAGYPALPGRVLQSRPVDEKGPGDVEGRHLAGAQLRAAGRAGQARAARRQRSARRPHRRLAVAIRVRAARLRHPHRAAARRRRRALPHRRRAASGVRDSESGADRDDQSHQAAGADGDRRKAPAAGRPDQDRGAGRRRGRAADLDDADRVRRKDRDADLHAGGAGPRFHRARASRRTTASAGRR